MCVVARCRHIHDQDLDLHNYLFSSAWSVRGLTSYPAGMDAGGGYRGACRVPQFDRWTYIRTAVEWNSRGGRKLKFAGRLEFPLELA